MRSISSLFARLAAFGAAAAVLACGSDTLLDPILGSGCNAGAMHAGDTVTSSFSDSSCAFTNYFWHDVQVPYESYTVSLSKGRAYMFTESNIPDSAHGGLDDVDAQLTLWGKNSDGVNVPLAASDDEAAGASGLNSVIFFVAPTSGTFQLVASSYDWALFGGYELTMNECPVLARLDTVGTYNLTLPSSHCIRVNAGDNPTDTAQYSMIAIPVGPGDSIKTVINSAAFTPTWEMNSPGFDIYANLYDTTEYRANTGTGNSSSMTIPVFGGTVTLAVGSTRVDSAGAFSIVLSGVAASAPPVGAAPWSVTAQASGIRKPRRSKIH